jgi:hypothetical protein
MRHQIKYVGLRSALRMAGLIGPVVWLVPSLLLSGIVVTAVLRLDAAFTRLSSLTVAIPAQAIGPLTLELPPLTVDLVDRLGLAVADQAITSWSARPWVLFFALTIGLVLLATMLSMVVAAVAVVVYNLVASRFGGLEVRLSAQPDSGATPLLTPRGKGAGV